MQSSQFTSVEKRQNLEINVVRNFYNKFDYNSSFSIVNMTNLTLTVQLNFSAPLNVSAFSTKDLVTV